MKVAAVIAFVGVAGIGSTEASSFAIDDAVASDPAAESLLRDIDPASEVTVFAESLLRDKSRVLVGGGVEEVLHNHPGLLEKYSYSSEDYSSEDYSSEDYSSEDYSSEDYSSEDSSQRRLRGHSYPSVVRDAWSRIYNGYPPSKTIIYKSFFGLGQDRIKVERVGSSTCWIVAQESRDAGVWWKNMQMRHEIISGTDGERGHAGFVTPFNSVRYELENLIKSECSGLNDFVYAGFSRGGAIVQVAALSHMRQGITTSSNNVHLVTFGSPRALERAGALQAFLDTSHRVVGSRPGLLWGTSYDPASSAPPASWGFEHVGKTRYPDSLAPNGPTFGMELDVSLHFQYFFMF